MSPPLAEITSYVVDASTPLRSARQAQYGAQWRPGRGLWECTPCSKASCAPALPPPRPAPACAQRARHDPGGSHQVLQRAAAGLQRQGECGGCRLLPIALRSAMGMPSGGAPPKPWFPTTTYHRSAPGLRWTTTRCAPTGCRSSCGWSTTTTVSGVASWLGLWFCALRVVLYRGGADVPACLGVFL